VFAAFQKWGEDSGEKDARFMKSGKFGVEMKKLGYESKRLTAGEGKGRMAHFGLRLEGSPAKDSAGSEAWVKESEAAMTPFSENFVIAAMAATTTAQA
jgi:hypothetical protein